MGMDDRNHDKVPVVIPLSRQAIEQRAEEFLAKHSPKALAVPQQVDVVGLCDRLPGISDDVEFAVDDLPSGIGGRFAGGVLTLSTHVYEAALDGDPRARFTCAHELGHVVLHHQQLALVGGMRSGVALYRRNEIPAYRDPEWQANAFAAPLLMPANMVRLVVSRMPDWLPAMRVDRVMHIFGVSRQCADYRLQRLGEVPTP